MRRWLFFILFSACSAETPCLDLVEKACLMAKEKARESKGSPEEAQQACEAARARAEKADEAMNAACAQSPATYRKNLLAPKKIAPTTQPK